MHLDWQFIHYKELSVNEFHDIIALRLKTFVVEQSSVYLDLDGKDKKCYHLLLRDGKGVVIATARIIPPGVQCETTSIGRVVIDPEKRGTGLGQELMDHCVKFALEEFGNIPIQISAQKHLEAFYNKAGFTSTGKEYLEDDIPHVEMIHVPNN